MSDTYTRPTLTDGDVSLRVAVPEDTQARFEAGNHAEIQHMYGKVEGEVPPMTRQKAERWVCLLYTSPSPRD